ncbi:hypothetical protein ACA910_018213 [Epithemia clementina (nom. ined.)]
MSTTTRILFGESRFLVRRKYIRLPDDDECDEVLTSFDSQEDDLNCFDVVHIDSSHCSAVSSCWKNSVRYFLGFMYEEQDDDLDQRISRRLPNDDDEDDTYEDEMTTVESSLEAPSIWNRLNGALCTSLVLSSAATSVPVALVTAMTEFQPSSGSGNNNNFVTRATAAAVWGTSVGKFLNGFVTDLFGARRTAVIYCALLALALLRLALTSTTESAVWACFWTEFCASVQWPTVIVTLATHYRGHGSMYEGGIYLAALAARFGSLIGIMGSSWLLRNDLHWRAVAAIGAWMAMQASAFSYLYGWDAPSERDQPQNPVDPILWRQYLLSKQKQQQQHSHAQKQRHSQQNARTVSSLPSSAFSVNAAIHWIVFLLSTVVWPSMKHVLGSSVFWLVAVAHSGASMAKSSVLVVGTYLADTNKKGVQDGDTFNNSIRESGNGGDYATTTQFSGLAVFLSLGTLAGLMVAGHFFAVQSNHARRRKWLVSKLYLTMIFACYCLAFLALPSVATFLDDLLLFLQVSALFVLGVGISVPYYHLPSLVSANFPQHKALFLSLTEGVAYGITGWLWNVVGKIVAAGEDGWCYGWACVALLLILTAFVMVEFLEHYYCRHEQASAGGSALYETIVFA